MACFIGLPSELLLNIASRIDGPKHSSDLYNLALACRALRPIAQETLFRNPVVTLPGRHLEPTKASYLARSLVERPDLARLAKSLAIPLVFSPPHLPWVKTYSKPILEVEVPNNLGLFAELYLETMRLQLNEQSEIINDFCVGTRIGYVGLCLAFMPALESLTLPMYDIGQYPATEFRVNSLFVCKVRPETLNGLPAFGHLKSLSTNCPLPWSIVALPSLTTLHFAMNQNSNTITDFPETRSSLGIRSLTVDISVVASTVGSLTEDRFSYLDELMYHAKYLEDLSLRLTKEGQSHYFRYASFAVLMSHVAFHKRLKIDTADLDPQIQQKFKYLRSLSKFPGLKHVILPQEALIDRHKNTFTQLPSGVQEVGIIDSTKALNSWVVHICAKHSRFPELSKIALWCDRLSEPLQDDESCYARWASRNIWDLDTAVASDPPETTRLNEHIWDEIRRSSITVEKHGTRERYGWR